MANGRLSAFLIFLEKSKCIDKGDACCQLLAPRSMNKFLRDYILLETKFFKFFNILVEQELSEIRTVKKNVDMILGRDTDREHKNDRAKKRSEELE